MFNIDSCQNMVSADHCKMTVLSTQSINIIHPNRVSACSACNDVIGTVSALMIAKSECQIILYFFE